MPSVPDQMIVNEYPAGTGIRAHVDHDAFDDAIVSISLGSSCVMELSRSLAESTEPIFLEPRSALVLAGEARHKWTARDSRACERRVAGGRAAARPPRVAHVPDDAPGPGRRVSPAALP